MWLGCRRRARLLCRSATVVSPLCESTAAGRPRRGVRRLSAGAGSACRRCRFRHRPDAAAFGERARRRARPHAWRRRCRPVSRRRAPVRQRRLGVACLLSHVVFLCRIEMIPHPACFTLFLYLQKKPRMRAKRKVQRQRGSFISISFPCGLLLFLCFFLLYVWVIARRWALGSLAACVSVMRGRVGACASGPRLMGRHGPRGRRGRSTPRGNKGRASDQQGTGADHRRQPRQRREKEGIVVAVFFSPFFCLPFSVTSLGAFSGCPFFFFFWFSWTPSFLQTAATGGKKSAPPPLPPPPRQKGPAATRDANFFFGKKAGEKHLGGARPPTPLRTPSDRSRTTPARLCAHARTFSDNATFGRAASIAPPSKPTARERSRGSTSARASLRRKGKGRLWPNPTPILEEPPAASPFRPRFRARARHTPRAISAFRHGVLCRRRPEEEEEEEEQPPHEAHARRYNGRCRR